MSALPASLAVYRLATRLLEPFAPYVLRARVRRGKEDPARLGERLGHASLARPAGPLAWLHGASVGEALSLLPLAGDLIAAKPGLTVLITSGTRTSAELIARRRPEGVIHQFLPIDGPAAVQRFYDHWRPDLGVFVESELWPNLLIEARRRDLRMALLSAKLSAASLRGWTRFPAAVRTLLEAFELVLAQDEAAAGRFAILGIDVAGVADMKFGAPPLPADADALAALDEALGGRPAIVAASTHPGEDEIVLAAFAAALRDPALAARAPLLAIVPRHPERGAAVAAQAAGAGLTVSRQGAGEPIGAAHVRVADALGELGLWYRRAALAIVGGSLAHGFGGHNPLEPARLGRPFVSGPYIANWKSAYRGLAVRQATALVEPSTLGGWIASAILGAPELGDMAERAKAFVDERDSQTRALAGRLADLLP